MQQAPLRFNPETVCSLKNHNLAIVASSTIALTALFVIDQLLCVLRGGCVEDDASIRASALLVPMAVAYLVGSWIIVYPSALWLAQRMHGVLASVVASVSFGLFGCLAMHRQGVDGSFAHTLSMLLLLLTLPWFLGCLVALVLWPKSPTKTRSAPVQNDA
jgi:hypothetical protein